MTKLSSVLIILSIFLALMANVGAILDPELSSKLEQFYKDADKNADQKVTLDEMLATARSYYDESIIKMSQTEFNDADTDNDKFIYLAEYLTKTLGPEFDSEEYKNIKEYEVGLFNSVDDNGDSKLSFDEFKHINNPYESDKALDHLAKAALSVFSQEDSLKVSYDDLMKEKHVFDKTDGFKDPREFFDSVLDLDKDGYLNQSEVKNLFKITQYDNIDHDIKRLYQTMDADKDSELVLEELKVPVAKQLFEALNPFEREAADDDGFDHDMHIEEEDDEDDKSEL